jgi:hypothetical protein
MIDYFEFQTEPIPYGAYTLYSPNCLCGCCNKIRHLIKENGMITSGGWADPRRGYLESEEDFLERVPDGFIRWAEDHE